LHKRLKHRSYERPHWWCSGWLGHWTAKFEYLFVDLGSFNTTFTGLGGCFGVVIGSLFSCTPTAPGTGTIRSTITDNIVRVGLNYQFH
jgi:outer membrane immunogenic protein